MDDLDAALEKLTLNEFDQEAVKTLAALSKTSAAFRERLADRKALETLIEVVECSLDKSLETLDQVLRCVGNACADNNSARDIINELGFSWAIQCLTKGDHGTKLLTTKVLYNICLDYAPSQQQCYRETVHYALIAFLNPDGSQLVPDFLPDEDVESASSAVDLLFWITGHKGDLEPTLSEPLPEEVMARLLSLPLRFRHADIDNYAQVMESTIVFLRDQVAQKAIVKGIETLFLVLERTESRATGAEDPEHAKLVEPMCTSLIWCMSDIAAQPEVAEFARQHDYVRQFAKMIADRFPRSSGSGWKTKALLTAECEVLGNVLWNSSPEEYAFVVEEEALALDDKLLKGITEVRSEPSGAALLHSMAALLIHLTRPSISIRERMGSRQYALPALERLCRHEMPQIKQNGLKLLRALGRDCPVNQERFAELAREAMLSLQEGNDTAAEAAPN